MQNILTRFFADACGATAIEYGIIAAGIAFAIIAAVTQFLGSVGTIFTSVDSSIH